MENSNPNLLTLGSALDRCRNCKEVYRALERNAARTLSWAELGQLTHLTYKTLRTHAEALQGVVRISGNNPKAIVLGSKAYLDASKWLAAHDREMARRPRVEERRVVAMALVTIRHEYQALKESYNYPLLTAKDPERRRDRSAKVIMDALVPVADKLGDLVADDALAKAKTGHPDFQLWCEKIIAELELLQE